MKYNIEDIKGLLLKKPEYHSEDGWFFPGDLSPHNRSFNYACKKLHEQGKLEREGYSSDRWGYMYKIKNDEGEKK